MKNQQPDHKKVPVIWKVKTKAKILEVKKLDTKIKVEEKGDYENRSIILRLGVQCIVSPLEEVTSIEIVDAQASLESFLNPSDFYFRANTYRKPGASAGFGNPELAEIKLEYTIDQRPISECGQQWKEPRFIANENIRHLSFDSGMEGGFNQWQMYRLDFTKLDDVKFEFVKKFTYVQGQVVDQ